MDVELNLYLVHIMQNVVGTDMNYMMVNNFKSKKMNEFRKKVEIQKSKSVS